MVSRSFCQSARSRLWSRMNRRMSASGSSGSLVRSTGVGSTRLCRRANGSCGGRAASKQALALVGRLQLANGEIARAAERDRVRRVQELLDRVGADRGVLDVGADPVGARLERGDGLLGVGAGGEGEVVLEEVVVAVDVGDGQDLQAQGIVAHQVGEGRVAVDHHLVGQAGDAMVVHGLGLLERLAEAPVRVVRGHAVIGHVAQHAVLVADLELLRVAVEPDLGHDLAHPVVPVFEVAHRPVGHEPRLCCVAAGPPDATGHLQQDGSCRAARRPSLAPLRHKATPAIQRRNTRNLATRATASP